MWRIGENGRAAPQRSRKDPVQVLHPAADGIIRARRSTGTTAPRDRLRCLTERLPGRSDLPQLDLPGSTHEGLPILGAFGAPAGTRPPSGRQSVRGVRPRGVPRRDHVDPHQGLWSAPGTRLAIATLAARGTGFPTSSATPLPLKRHSRRIGVCLTVTMPAVPVFLRSFAVSRACGGNIWSADQRCCPSFATTASRGHLQPRAAERSRTRESGIRPSRRCVGGKLPCDPVEPRR